MLDLDVAVTGIKQVVSRIDRLTAGLEDMRPLFQELRRDFNMREFSWFGTEGDGWVPLSPRYAAWKDRLYPGQPIMVLRGDLRDDMLLEGSESVDEIHRDRARFGSRRVYARAQHAGRPEINLPARPLMPPTEEFEGVWGEIAREWAGEVVRDEWGRLR